MEEGDEDDYEHAIAVSFDIDSVDHETHPLRSNKKAPQPYNADKLEKNTIAKDELQLRIAFGMCCFTMVVWKLEVAIRGIGWCLYFADVVTDIYSGAVFITGDTMDYTKFENENYTNYTRNVCDNFDSYSHPIWGTVVISLAWVPAIVLLPPLLMHWSEQASGKIWKRDDQTSNESWGKTIVITLLLLVIWPLSGIIM